MTKLKLQLTPESQAKLDKLARLGKVDLRPTMKIIGIGYRKEVEAIFGKKQPRQTGLRWKALSEPYATRKAAQYPGAPILVRTGRLRKSMIQQGAADNLTIIGKSFGVFGSTVPYGVYHDEGTSRLPKRNFSEPSERRFEIWKGQIAKDIARNFEANGISVDTEIFQQ